MGAIAKTWPRECDNISGNPEGMKSDKGGEKWNHSSVFNFSFIKPNIYPWFILIFLRDYW